MIFSTGHYFVRHNGDGGGGVVVTVGLLKVHRAENKRTILRTTCIRNTEIIFKEEKLIN